MSRKPWRSCKDISYPFPATARRIIAQTAAEHGVTVAEMTGPGQARHLAAARWQAMHRLYHRKSGRQFSSLHIGWMLNRDHSTVLYGLRRADELFATPEAAE